MKDSQSHQLQNIAAIATIVGTVVTIIVLTFEQFRAGVWSMIYSIYSLIFLALLILFLLFVSKKLREIVWRIATNIYLYILLFILIIFLSGVYVGTFTATSPQDSPTPSLESDESNFKWPPQDGILTTVRQNRKIRCGINGNLPGFSIKNKESFEGFDADFCRVIAIAIFGEDFEDKIEFISVEVDERLHSVESGKVDVLIRNTTWTAGRDIDRNVDFGPIIFVDGQGFLVKNDSGIASLSDLKDQSVCVLPDTTTLTNLKTILPSVTPVTKRAAKIFRTNDDVFTAYDSFGECNAMTADRAQLIIYPQKYEKLDEYVLLDDIISKEPLAPVIVSGDRQWYDIVSYAIYATIYASEKNIISSTVEDLSKNSVDSTIKKFLGSSDSGLDQYIGDLLDLDKEFAYNIIKLIGNYDEIYERNLGEFIPERGPNSVWDRTRKIGILISPRFLPHTYSLPEEFVAGPFKFNTLSDMEEENIQQTPDIYQKKYSNTDTVVSIYDWKHEDKCQKNGYLVNNQYLDYYSCPLNNALDYKYHFAIQLKQDNFSQLSSDIGISIESNRKDAEDLSLAIFRTINFMKND